MSDFQYASFQILAVHLDFGLFWSADIATMRVIVDQDVQLLKCLLRVDNETWRWGRCTCCSGELTKTKEKSSTQF